MQGKVAGRKTSKESFFSAKVEHERAFYLGTALREFSPVSLEGGHTSSFDDV